MNIGIIGAGMVGSALAKALSKADHQIKVSAKNPAGANLQAVLSNCGPNVSAGDNQSVVDFGDIIVLASPWPETRTILKDLHGLDGKPLLDATNPVLPDFSGLDPSVNSGGEAVAEWAPGARVVKTLNHISSDMMARPQLSHGMPIMFVAGDDPDAKAAVSALLKPLGFDPEDCGGLSMSAHLESLAWLYINRAMIQGKGRNFAFTVTSAADHGSA